MADFISTPCAALGNARVELFRATHSGPSFVKHWHDAWSLGVIARGTCRFWYRGAMREAPAGTVVVIPPGEVHTGGGMGNGAVVTYDMLYLPAHALDVAVSPAGSGRRVSQLSDSPTWPQRPDLAALLRDMVDAVQECDWLKFETRLIQVGGNLAASSAKVERNVPRCVKIAREYIDAHFDGPVTLARLALETSMNPQYLVRAFSAAVGMPPHAYLVHTRIAHAKRLLAGGRTAAAVAVTCGFYDQSQLNRHFKRHVGVTPSTYRVAASNDVKIRQVAAERRP